MDVGMPTPTPPIYHPIDGTGALGVLTGFQLQQTELGGQVNMSESGQGGRLLSQQDRMSLGTAPEGAVSAEAQSGGENVYPELKRQRNPREGGAMPFGRASVYNDQNQPPASDVPVDDRPQEERRVSDASGLLF